MSSSGFLRGPLRALAAADSCSNPLPPYTERHADGVAGASLARKGLQVQVLVRLAVPCVSVTHDEPYEGAPVGSVVYELVRPDKDEVGGSSPPRPTGAARPPTCGNVVGGHALVVVVLLARTSPGPGGRGFVLKPVAAVY